MDDALSQSTTDDQGTDYVLNEKATSCWITVDNISIYIVRTEEGVAVEIYPLNHEMDEMLGCTYAPFAAAEIEE